MTFFGESIMTTRILLADQSTARFYDIDQADAPLRLVGELTDPDSRLKDRDLKSDRPGRVYDHASTGTRRSAVPHHSTGGEETPRRHGAQVFANRIVHELETAREARLFDRLVLIAGPQFMGMLRSAMSKHLTEVIGAEVLKDLLHAPESAVRAHLAETAFPSHELPSHP